MLPELSRILSSMVKCCKGLSLLLHMDLSPALQSLLPSAKLYKQRVPKTVSSVPRLCLQNACLC